MGSKLYNNKDRGVGYGVWGVGYGVWGLRCGDWINILN